MVMRKIAVAVTSLSLVASMGAPAFAKGHGDHERVGHINFNHSILINNSVNDAANFEDVDADNYGWAAQAISKLASEGIIAGIKEGNHRYFNPGGKLSRADYAALVARFFNLQPAGSNQDFNDVQPGTWYFNSVEAAKDYMTHFTSNGVNYFHPTSIMNRAETAVTLVEVLLKQNAVQLVSDDQANQILSTYTDAGQIPVQLRAYVATAIQYGLMQGTGDNQFDPLGHLNRAQAAELLFNLQTQTEVPPTGTTTTTGTTTEVAPGSTTTTTTTTNTTGLSGQLAAPSDVTQNGTVNYTFTVYQNGATDTALNGSYNVTASTTNGAASVTSPVTFTNGVATVPVSLDTTGSQTLTVSFPDLNVSAAATVNPTSATSTTSTTSTATSTSGSTSTTTSLSGNLVAPANVAANTVSNYTLNVYQNGSLDTALNGSYDVTVTTTNSAGATVTTPVTFTNGVATLPISLLGSGTQNVTVTAKDLNLTATTSVNAQ